MSEPIDRQPRGVHLVGSLPKAAFPTVAEVFSTIPSMLPGRLRRLPDGELGDRHNYIQWQEDVFPREILKSTGARNGGTLPNQPDTLKLQDIKPVRYDDDAIASYKEFARAQASGIIPHGVRFQVSLPSPTEAPAAFVHESYQEAAAALYERRLREALDRIQQEIPPENLAIQWDVAVSIALIETKRNTEDCTTPCSRAGPRILPVIRLTP